MKYLFDTDTITTLLKPRPPQRLLRRIQNVEPRNQHISTITISEISYGAHKNNNPRKHLDFLELNVLPRVRVLTFDDTAAYMAGRIRAEKEKLGQPLAPLDLQIAAIAKANGCILVTGNIRHFESIPGLEVQNWIDI
ncbi:MAG: PIN domain-containing protein [Spirochaetaceae bacterium]|nr:MAG: PIN domain-containing protein [Spirochaetaceae bacterium]